MMQLFRDVASNSDIPSTMSREGLEFLAEIARSLRAGAVIAEAGAFYGATAWTLSKNAPAGAKIYSMGPWQHLAWMDGLAKNFAECPPLSLEAFRKYTSDCKNVVPVTGLPPQALMHVSELDLYFENSADSNPAFAQNVNFFATVLRPGGILCGNHYGPVSPDVVNSALKLAHAWKTPLLVRGRVWAMVKPDLAQATPLDIVDALSGQGRWGIALETRKGNKYMASHDAFSGAFGFKAQISGLSFFSDGLPLKWRARVIDASGREAVLETDDWYRNRGGEIVAVSVACEADGEPVKGDFQCIFLRKADGTLHYSRRQDLGKLIRRTSNDEYVLCDMRVRPILPKSGADAAILQVAG